jgi:hypothetical protein
MTTFDKARAARDTIPLRHVVLHLDAFADDWREKPEGGEIALGLRKVSDADAQTARAEAAKFATDMHDDQQGQIESFNDALMRWLVVRGTCDANDVTKNAPLFDGSEENVRNALTSKAIRYIWDEIDRFHVETSPLVSAASDEDMVAFSNIVAQVDLLNQMSSGAALRIRKLVSFCLTEMREVIKGTE